MDPSIYDDAEPDPEGFWAQQAEALDWFERWDQVLDWSNPPFAKWFVGSQLNVSYNCLTTGVEAGRGDRVAFHWRGEEGEERDVTYTDLHADVQRFANALRDRGIVRGQARRRDLHSGDPGGRRCDARVRARRGRPQRRLRRLLAGVGARADGVLQGKALITVDGARRKGKTAPIKSAVDEVITDLPCIVVKHTGAEAPMADKDAWFHELMEAADAECRPSRSTPSTRCSSSTSLDRQAEGDPPHRRRLPDARRVRTRPSSTSRPTRTSAGARPTSAGSTRHSYIVYGPLANGATSIMYEGAPDYPDKDIWWELCERYGVTIFYTAPTAIRACIKWGTEYPERHDLSKLRLLGTVGEPINPKAWLWYYKVIGGERCPIVDTWWRTANGRDHDHDAARDPPGRSRAAPARRCRASRPRSSTTTARTRAPRGDSSRSSGRGRCCARSIRRTTASSRRTGRSSARRPTPSATPRALDEDGYFWIIGRIDDVLNVSGHRMSTAEIESAIVSYERVAEAAVIGQADEDAGQSVTAFVTLQGGTDAARTS